MARPSKPWYRAGKYNWYVTLDGRKVSLQVRGEENEADAIQAWHWLFATGSPGSREHWLPLSRAFTTTGSAGESPEFADRLRTPLHRRRERERCVVQVRCRRPGSRGAGPGKKQPKNRVSARAPFSDVGVEGLGVHTTIVTPGSYVWTWGTGAHAPPPQFPKPRRMLTAAFCCPAL
jgi:hypothetical protein